MDLKKELLEFLEANNNFGLEDPEKVVDLYIEVYNKEPYITSFVGCDGKIIYNDPTEIFYSERFKQQEQ
jgi:hypothetical protein